MCGRYVLANEPDVLVAEFDARVDPGLVGLIGRDFHANYNISPGSKVPVITAKPGARVISAARWGLVPKWSKGPSTVLLNARGESVAEKITFAKAFARNRILIPATGYYEWKRPDKDPYFISPPVGDAHPMAMAGLMSESMIDGRSELTCVIITLAAQPNLAAIHDRMPACVTKSEWSAWLDPSTHIQVALDCLIARSDLRAFRVDRAVNSVRNNSPALIKEFTEAG
jgi:putative SOS response-associated peptidase YedK